MGAEVKQDCPFCAENARKRREEMEAADREAFPEKGSTDCIDTGMGNGIDRDGI